MGKQVVVCLTPLPSATQLRLAIMNPYCPKSQPH